jgi:single-stranded DNA-binding protein
MIFNKRLAEIGEKYLRKGSKVYLEGRIADPQTERQ